MTGNKIQAIIIDDEQSARKTLRLTIEQYCPSINILGEADSVPAGQALIKQVNPELIFLDVEMPSGTGFDLLEKMHPLEAGIIFTTAHDKYALHAIKVSALDYLLKPIDPDELVNAVAKFQRKKLQVTPEVLELLRHQLDSKKEQTERLAVPSLHGFEIVKVTDIMYCEADSNYTNIHITGREPLMSSKTLKDYEMLLPTSVFLRVHQSYLVNINYVKKYLKGRGGTLIMNNGKNIEVSKNKKQALIDVLG